MRVKAAIAGNARCVLQNQYKESNVLKKMLIDVGRKDNLIACNYFLRLGYILTIKNPKMVAALYTPFQIIKNQVWELRRGIKNTMS